MSNHTPTMSSTTLPNGAWSITAEFGVAGYVAHTVTIQGSVRSIIKQVRMMFAIWKDKVIQSYEEYGDLRGYTPMFANGYPIDDPSDDGTLSIDIGGDQVPDAIIQAITEAVHAPEPQDTITSTPASVHPLQHIVGAWSLHHEPGYDVPYRTLEQTIKNTPGMDIANIRTYFATHTKVMATAISLYIQNNDIQRATVSAELFARVQRFIDGADTSTLYWVPTIKTMGT